MKYTIILIPDDNGTYEVQVPALPGVHTYGRTADEATANAREAIKAHLAALREMGEPVPADRANPLAVEIDVAA